MIFFSLLCLLHRVASSVHQLAGVGAAMTVVTYRQNITGTLDCRFKMSGFKLTVTDSLAQSIESFIASQNLQNDERPNKRRKLEENTTEDLFQVADRPARNEHVVLCRITIDLVSCFYRKLTHKRASI